VSGGAAVPVSEGAGVGESLVGGGVGESLVGGGVGESLSVGESEALADADAEEDAEADADEEAEAEEEADAEEEAEAEDEAEADEDADLPGAGDLAGVTDEEDEDGLTNSESGGLRTAFGEAAGVGASDELPETDGVGWAEVVWLIPVFGSACVPAMCGDAPVSAKTAAAEAATRPPVIPADAIGRVRRCRACRPLPAGSGGPAAAAAAAAGLANASTLPEVAASSRLAADWVPAEP